METCPNRTAVLAALPAGTILKDASECGDGVIVEVYDDPHGRLVVATDCDWDRHASVGDDDVCWPWWIDTADEDLDDPERITEWQIERPQTKEPS